ncbi:hypothetical protein KAFR_0L01630 [Kazachstania africana CBS 2517]|uniref:Uncharacterized protein n=1 Tax=Kazachstania africana (strain ATCC 22294 / BCRC 22015 / CBS 2517 / CECT 1963 / NBRC 1671 / NRRL Y-8276) TaxID=1071382 RepID=H2B2C3_KAZAF|nr:hypothetical protein KAFR_0L01630 [Kazachstania africana CBS 2517]CCF60773.1 hypothetical protein KAFR_0L01630 [Kazachstania africana CBS 2517]
MNHIKSSILRAMPMKYYDIGFNIVDPMFQGVYHGRKSHDSDILHVLNRATRHNVKAALLTGSSIEESKETIQMASQLRDKTNMNLYYTIGVHPCCVNEFCNTKSQSSTIDNPSNDHDYNKLLHDTMWDDLSYPKAKLKELYELYESQLASSQYFRAIGEIGLDYDRLNYSCKDLQLLFFEEQLKISCLLGEKGDKLPLFLHMRNCGTDFIKILSKFIKGFTDNEDRFEMKKLINTNEPIVYRFHPERKFVVHSFTDTVEDMENLLNLSPNCYVGMNGASFRNDENIEAVKKVPIDRLLLETDAPWCEIKRTHSSYKYLQDYKMPFNSVKKDKLAKIEEIDWEEYMIKSRNEPCTMEQNAIVVSNIKNLELAKVAEVVWDTTCSIYGE